MEFAAIADTITLNAGSGGATLSTDEVTIGAVLQHVQRVKLVDGADGGTALIGGDATNGLDVDVTRVSGTVTVDGTGGSFPVTDSGGSLTVDNAALAVTGGGVEASALRVTLASDSTGVLSVDDNGGSLTVDGTVSVSGAVDTELTTADLDTGAGTDTRAVVGLVLAASGGGLLVGSANPMPISDNSGSLTVDGTVTANLAAGTNNIGDVDVLSIAAGDNNIGNVDIVTMPNVTLAAGTNTNEVVGDAAHDAAIAGNPVRIGARALSADYTAVATGDTADLIATLLGKQVVYPYSLPGTDWHYAAASGGITNTTGVTAKAAAGAGIRNYVTRAEIINGHATVSTDIQIRDGAAGTVLWRGFAQAAGGGVACVFDPPLRGTANTLIEVACGTTGSATYFNLHGFSAAE